MKQALQTFGLSEGEIAVLMACMEGSTTPTDIAQQTGIHRSTVYFHLGNLEARGLITTRARGRQRLVQVRSLADVLGKEVVASERTLSAQQDALKGLTAALQDLPGKEITTTQRPEDLFSIIDDIIATGADIYWIGSFTAVTNTVGVEGFAKRMTWRRAEQETTMYAISNEAFARNKDLARSFGNFRKVKVLPSIREEATLLACYGAHIVYISGEMGELQMGDIHDAASARLFMAMYHALWEQLT